MKRRIMKKRMLRKKVNYHRKLLHELTYTYGLNNSSNDDLLWSNNKRKLNKLSPINKKYRNIHFLSIILKKKSRNKEDRMIIGQLFDIGNVKNILDNIDSKNYNLKNINYHSMALIRKNKL